MNISNFIRYNVGYRLNRFIKGIKNKNLRMKIIKYYQNSSNPEIIRTINYIKSSKRVLVINDPLIDNYKLFEAEVLTNIIGKYVIYDSKKLYFPSTMTNEKIIKFLKEVIIEQDIDSPHRYIDDFEFIKDKIVIEIGAAEGSFSLKCVDLAKKLYLFECDNNWNEALNNTFKLYGDKAWCVVERIIQ